MPGFHIAIDGPVSAGKGTISRLVAEKLGFLYVDTGAMYRMTALLAKNHQVDLADEPAVVALVTAAKMEMRNPNDQERDGRLTTVILDGEDVSWKIRTEEISAGSSKVAQLADVRKVLVEKQQQIAANQDVIMEGRDITYRVLPNAQLKIYLTANDTVRAERRHLQLQMRGEDISFETVYTDVLERDKRDMSRAADPLQVVPDAWQVDTTDLAIEKVVEMIVAKAKLLGAAAQS
jgi:cytidylate kinase